MNFGQFLGEVRAKGNFPSTRAFYDAMSDGGAKLNMSLRNFQLLENENQPPSFKAFASIFKKLDRSRYHKAIISFFESHLDSKEDRDLLEYIRNHLSPAFERSRDNIWETNRPSVFYTVEQMQAMVDDPELLKLHHTLLLYEKMKIQKSSSLYPVGKKLVELHLAEIENGELKTVRTLFRAPKYENSSPKAVRKASEMLAKHFDVYASLEGGLNQNMSYAIQLVDKKLVGTILEQMEQFKRWVQSLASPKVDDTVVPVVFFSWGRVLGPNELSVDNEQR